MFTYGEAETILAALHGADRERQEGALRARLKHFKKLGIPLGVNPGRGKKIEYSHQQLYQWVFCLECAQFGIEPTWVVNAIEKHWDTIYVIFKAAQLKPSRVDADPPWKNEPEPNPDWFMVFSPAFMTGTWSGEPLSDPLDPQYPFFAHITETQIPDVIARMHGNARRVGLLNVSEVVRIIEKAERSLPPRRRPNAAFD